MRYLIGMEIRTHHITVGHHKYYFLRLRVFFFYNLLLNLPLHIVLICCLYHCPQQILAIDQGNISRTAEKKKWYGKRAGLSQAFPNAPSNNRI